MSAANIDTVPSRPGQGAALSKMYRSKPFQFTHVVRRPLSLSERMGQGLAAYQGSSTAFGKYREEQRTAWAEKRITISVRAAGRQTTEVSSTVETYVDGQPHVEPSDEEQLNQALKDGICSWFT